MWSFIWRQTSDRLAGLARVLIAGVLVAACGIGDQGGGGVLPPPPPASLALFAGNLGGAGNSDGTSGEARFWGQRGVATDSFGSVYVADSYNHTIRKITPAGVVTTLAGRAGASGSADGTGADARFANPQGVATDSAGNVYVADSYNHTIRKITPAGVVSTLAGLAGAAGSADGTGAEARLNVPSGIATDWAGNVYVSDTANNRIRKISAAGIVSTLAGTGEIGSADGPGAAASFGLCKKYVVHYNSIKECHLGDVAADTAGNVYVADYHNHTIRKITSAGVVTTLAGRAGTSGSADGTGADARFHYPKGVATDSAGNVYVADSFNHTIRKINPAGVVTTLAGRAGASGSADGTGADARFYYPEGVATDSAGSVYVADALNHTIRNVTPDGVVSTLAGSAEVTGSSDGTGAEARFALPFGIATDSAGNVYVADTGNVTIRKITPAGVVTTLAGSAGPAGSADGTGADARFARPWGIATDNFGNVYVADTDNNTIRKIAPGGVVTTLAGPGFGDGADGTGAAAGFYGPKGVATDSSGNVYVADTGQNKIRKISPDGVVSTLAGSVGLWGSADGMGSEARFYEPTGIATDTAGNVYVADTKNHTIRKITPAGVVTTLAGRAAEPGGADGPATEARFRAPWNLDMDSAGNVYVADSENHTIRKISRDGMVTTVVGVAGVRGFKPGGLPGVLSFPTGIAVRASTLYVTSENGVAVVTNVP